MDQIYEKIAISSSKTAAPNKMKLGKSFKDFFKIANDNGADISLSDFDNILKKYRMYSE